MLNGAFNILKPPGMSSHDVVSVVRELLKDVKVGHGGTLDPGAAGVLPILVGRATKLARFLLEYDKSYRGEIFLGKKTTTDDPEGDELVSRPVPFLQEHDLQAILKSFIGEIAQVPPLFSALKRGGKKYYDYAREGVAVTPPSRTVTIYKCDLVCFWPPHRFLLEVSCSKGTYIRALARDLGEKIGCGAHLSFLVRTAVGPFTLENSLTIEEFTSLASKKLWREVLYAPDFCLPHLRKLSLAGRELEDFLHGKKIEPALCSCGRALSSPEGYYKIYDQEGVFRALGQVVRVKNSFLLRPLVFF